MKKKYFLDPVKCQNPVYHHLNRSFGPGVVLIRVLWVVSVSLLARCLHFHVNARLCDVMLSLCCCSVLTSLHKQLLSQRCWCQLCCRRVCHQASCPFLPSPLHPQGLNPCPLPPVLGCGTLGSPWLRHRRPFPCGVCLFTCIKGASGQRLFLLPCPVHGASPGHERGEWGAGANKPLSPAKASPLNPL